MALAAVALVPVLAVIGLDAAMRSTDGGKRMGRSGCGSSTVHAPSLRSRLRRADLVVTAEITSHRFILFGAHDEAGYAVRIPIKGGLSAGAAFTLRGDGHVPTLFDGDVGYAGCRALVFALATDDPEVFVPLDSPGAVVLDEKLHGGNLWEYATIEEHVAGHLQRLASLPADPRAELDWILAMLEDSYASNHAVDDLLRNSRALAPRFGVSVKSDGSDLRRHMGPADVERLVGVLPGGHQATVLFGVAALLVDEPGDSLTMAMVQLLRDAVAADCEIEGARETFGEDVWSSWAAHDAELLLRALAARIAEPRLAELVGVFLSYEPWKPGRLAVAQEFLQVADVATAVVK